MQENIFAKGISYLFHPLLLPTMGLFLIFHLNDAGLFIGSSDARFQLYALTLLATFLLPLVSAIFFWKLGVISSLEMETKEERKLPYLTAAVFYSAESYFLMRYQVSVLAKALMIGATLVVVSVLIVNLFWKISAHMAGIGGLCGMMLAISFRLQVDLHLVLIELFLIAGFIGYARLKLQTHTPAQVYTGFLLGIFVELMLFLPFGGSKGA